MTRNSTAKRIRLDAALVSRGLTATRARARDLILRGEVQVAGRVVDKAGALVGLDAELEITGRGNDFVSRSALKLEAGLDAFGFDAAGRVAIDVGASTGGFTQVLLQHGAAKVYAVDVGHGQLAAAVKGDVRVVDLEGVDSRALDRTVIAEPVSAIAADVSFISLVKALPAALALAAPGCWLVALVKPQFELGPEAIGRGGLVRSEADGVRIAGEIASWIGSRTGWRTVGTCPSPLPGKSGNREYLVGAIFGE